MFISDEEVIYYGVKMLIAYMLSGSVIGILFVNMNCMQSVGDALPATVLNGVIYAQALTDYVVVILSIYLWKRNVCGRCVFFGIML